MSVYTLNEFAQKVYGKKLYKLSLNAGFTCPNRDGKIDNRGCIFCDGGGAGDFAGLKALPLSKQIEDQKKLIEKKLPKTKEVGYIAYFQAFTNTYATADKLHEVYFEVAKRDDIDVISIATRPDCLGQEVLSVLEKLNRIKPVWIELGLQTIHEKSSDYIRRGYELSVYDKAVSDLKKIGIGHIITHLIIGIPFETKEMILSSVEYVVNSGIDGIKLQLLHVLKNTDLEKEYREGRFDVLTEDEYLDILSDCIKLIPQAIVVHRLTGDGNKKNLIAPLWSSDKKRVMNRIKNEVCANY